MSGNEIRQKFLEYFKKNGHAVVASSPLIPDDPSVLLTTAGMQQFKKYFTGELDAKKDYKSLNTASVQKCFRTSDIDEVGDESHLTFFEMLGNFSFGGYFKKEAIKFGYEFIVKEMGLKIDYVTVFAGEPNVPADEESEKIWKSLDPNIEVRKAGRADNFWGPTGSEGPCGPTTEIYVNGIEIWNIVFNQYYQHANKKLEPLKTPGIDTGMGLERLAMVSQGVANIFETDLFDFYKEIKIALADYDSDRNRRIVVDHTRAIAFLIADGVRPSNKDAGYVLRRLLRRVIFYVGLPTRSLDAVIEKYGNFYQELRKNREEIITIISDEYIKFSKTLRKGLNELEKIESVDARSAFKLYESFGIPFELIKDYQGGKRAKNLNREDFDQEFKKHQEISRAGVEKKFGGHGLLLDTGELKAKDEAELKKVTRLHTATHLLQAALRKVLGNELQQKGSDITVERTRFDFNFSRKLTAEEIQKVEEIINEVIKKDLPVNKVQLPKDEAVKTGALYYFKEKYPEMVNVYFVGKDLESAFSKEFCGGPHVTHTGEIGEFKITKEESVGAGTRRVRAIVVP